jgi:hypothetical protein
MVAAKAKKTEGRPGGKKPFLDLSIVNQDSSLNTDTTTQDTTDSVQKKKKPRGSVVWAKRKKLHPPK